MEGTKRHQITGYGTYAYVWIGLLILTMVTIGVSRLHLTQYSVLLSLVIASCKAGLVLAFFMHLRQEGRFLRGMILLSFMALTAMIGLTFVDVWYR